MGEKQLTYKEYLFWALLGAFSFLPFLGASPLFDWDEINFAESAREMIATGNYFQVQIDFEPFWEKPPLFFWMQVLMMKIFGINEFAARLPNAIIGIFTLIMLVKTGTRFRNLRFGRMVAAFYFISILPHLYFKSGIIDPTFNFFIFMGLMHLLRFDLGNDSSEEVKSPRSPVWAGLWIGLAVLTKGPVALLVAGLVYFLYRAIWHRFRIPWLHSLKFFGVFIAVILAWFGSIVLFTEDGMEIIRKFIVYQVELFSEPVAGHEQPFYYHFVIFLIGCFPLAAFTFRGMVEKPQLTSALALKRVALVWWWVIMILFSIVKTKIVHYSSMSYFPGAMLAAFYLYRLMEENRRPKWDTYVLYGLGILVFGIAVSGINIVTANLGALQENIADKFAQANLEANVFWTGWEFLPAAFFAVMSIIGLVFLIQRKYQRFLVVMLVATPLYLNGLNGLIVPKVAEYTQGGAINFFKAHASEDAWFTVEGYKSYAHYFYAQTQPHSRPELDHEAWKHHLRYGKIEKPVYLVTRIDRLKPGFQEALPEFTEIGRTSGFVFFKREPGKSTEIETQGP